MWAVLKFGQYGIASKVLVQFVYEFPALFNPLIVGSVTAPASIKFALDSQETLLTSMLRRVAGASADKHLARLA